MYSCQIYLFYELAQEVHEIYIIREPHKPLKQIYKIAENVDEHIISVLNWFLEKIWVYHIFWYMLLKKINNRSRWVWWISMLRPLPTCVWSWWHNLSRRIWLKWMCATKYLHPARYLTYIMHSKQLLTVFVQISCLIGPSYGSDGSSCPFFCPTNSCPRDHTLCSGGSYENGCIKPDSCISTAGDIALLVFEIYMI